MAISKAIPLFEGEGNSCSQRALTHFLYVKAFFPSSCSLKGEAYEVTLSKKFGVSFILSFSFSFHFFPFLSDFSPFRD
jgi:hypothetical protein